jgi:acyl carrier protein phosphodiesterase
LNYLAHAYLSFGDPAILTGNMISDFIKGKKQFDYPLNIQAGIQLHRAIDEFTDFHTATKALKEFFRADYRLYSGAFADVVYDHFLALDTAQFADDKALMDFSLRSYSLLDQNQQWLGEKFGSMFPYMKSQNWLYNYQFDWAIQKSLEGVRRRSAYIKETAIAFGIFLRNKPAMKECYDEFFPDVKKFAASRLEHLLK